MNNEKRITFRTSNELFEFLEFLKNKEDVLTINQVLNDIVEEYKQKYLLAKDPKNSPFLKAFIEETRKTQDDLTDITSGVLNKTIKAINENTQLLAQLIVLNRYNSDKLSLLENKFDLFTGESDIDDEAFNNRNYDKLVNEALEYLKKNGGNKNE